MYRRILVATDGSKLSRKALKAAIGLAGSTGALLVVLHVTPRYPLSYFEGGASLEPEDIARIEKQWADQGRALVDAAAREAEAAGVSTRAAVVRSDAIGESILAAVRKHKCDLVVMASHGRRGLQRLLLGSETQHVLTHGAVPVLVLR